MSNEILPQWKDGRLIAVMNMELTDLPDEEWKEVPDFEKMYQLSNYGRIKSISRIIILRDGRHVHKQERILKLLVVPSKNADRYGVNVKFIKDKVVYFCSIPRLVYNVFVKPFDMNDKTLVVTRNDRNDLNCHYENLTLKIKNGTGANQYGINKYDKEGKFIQQYASIFDAAKDAGVGNFLMHEIVEKKYLQDEKFYWRYGKAHKNIFISKGPVNSEKKPVQKFSLDMQPLETYSSTKAAAKAMGVAISGISRACKKNHTCKGFRWRYAE